MTTLERNEKSQITTDELTILNPDEGQISPSVSKPPLNLTPAHMSDTINTELNKPHAPLIDHGARIDPSRPIKIKREEINLVSSSMSSELASRFDVYLVEEDIRSFQKQLHAVEVDLRAGKEIEDIPDEASEDLFAWKAQYPTLPEHRILYLITAGLSNEQIARALGRSQHTIKKQVSSILKKLGVHSRAAAANRAIEEGIVNPFLLSEDIDTSRLSMLTVRERELYDILAASNDGYINSEVADKLYIGLQTTKNHLTAIFSKLGVINKEHLRFYELMRRVRVEKKTSHNVIIRDAQHELLQFILQGMDDLAISNSLGLDIKTIRLQRQKLYIQLDSTTRVEAIARSIHYGIIPKDRIAAPASFDKVSMLTSEERFFLLRYSSFKDTHTIVTKASGMNASQKELTEKLSTICRKLSVRNWAQAVVIELVTQSEEHKRMFDEGKKRREVFRRHFTPDPKATDVFVVVKK